MIKKIFLGVFFILLLLGCASSASSTKIKNLPEWVENPDALYPKRLYLTAVSSGSSLDEARQRSIGSLSNIFSVIPWPRYKKTFHSISCISSPAFLFRRG